MTEMNDEVYSTIFSALKHGVRRRILWMLAEGQKSFTNMYESLEITSSHLNYHLESLGELVSKDNGAYRLSVFGRAAVDMMRNIESPPKLGVLGLEQNRGRMIVSLFLICLVSVSAILAYDYGVNSAYELAQSSLLNTADVIDASTRVPGLDNIIDEISADSGIVLVKRKELRYMYQKEHNPMRDHSILEESKNYVMVFYSPVDNATLNLVAIHGYMSELKSMPITIQKGNALKNESAIVVKSGYVKDHYFEVWQSEILWSTNTTSFGNTYDVSIPSKGWYTLCLTGPIHQSGSEPTVRYMWGERDDWIEADNVYANVYCTLQKDDRTLIFATKEIKDYFVSGYTLEAIYTELMGES